MKLSCPICPTNFEVETPQRARRAITQHLTRRHAIPYSRKKSDLADTAVSTWLRANGGE